MTACSDGGDGSDGDGAAGGEPPVTSEECQALCEKAKDCDEASDPCAGSWCADSYDRYRAEIRAALVSCSEAQQPFCQTELYDCLGQALAGVPAREADVAFQAACVQKSGACGFGFETCSISVVFDEAAVAEGQACLDQPCEAVEACLKDAFPL